MSGIKLDLTIDMVSYFLISVWEAMKDHLDEVVDSENRLVHSSCITRVNIDI